MKLQYLGYLAGSIASAAAAIVSFRANQINALEISPIYISWELIPNGEVNFPAKRITPPVYDDAQLLQATRFGGEVDVYVPQSDAAFDGGKLLTLSGKFQCNANARYLDLGSGNWANTAEYVQGQKSFLLMKARLSPFKTSRAGKKRNGNWLPKMISYVFDSPSLLNTKSLHPLTHRSRSRN